MKKQSAGQDVLKLTLGADQMNAAVLHSTKGNKSVCVWCMSGYADLVQMLEDSGWTVLSLRISENMSWTQG